MKTKRAPKAKPAQYHHGNLPEVLQKKALEHIEKYGMHNLSMRDLAKEIGVSHGAPYRHFEDKQELLASIAVDGYEILLVRLKAAVEHELGVAQKIEAMAWEYVRFVFEHNVHAQLMFSKDLHESKRFPKLIAASESLFLFGESVVALGQKENKIVPADVKLITATAWAHVHGLATLLNANRIPGTQQNSRGEATNKDFITQAARLLFHGIFKNAT